MTNSQTKVCQNCKNQFVIEPDDFAFYEKMAVPAPTFCPQCRFQRRTMFRNERHLYKRECASCKRTTLATLSPDKQGTVYCQECWWSDRWDSLDYGLDYDPQRPFFEQLKELFRRVPFPALSNNHPTLVNSEFVNESGWAKNCYLIFDADYCENVRYGTRLTHMKDSMDLFVMRESELCYEDVNCRKSSRLFFSEDCTDCINVYFSRNLSGCQNCLGCVNLKNKSHYLWNKPLAREDYEKELGRFKEELGTADGLERLRERAHEVWQSVPHKFMHGFNNVNVSGDYLYQSKNAKDSYMCRGLEDGRFCQLLKDETTKDAYDYTLWGANAQSIYECLNIGAGVNNAKFCYVCALGNTMNAEYSTGCLDVANIFGCLGVRKKKYCILNKQYTPEEFVKLRARIIEDMEQNPYVDSKGRVWKYGEFFPYEFSFYAYNETNAIEYFPITKEEAIGRGWRWRDETPPEHPITMQAVALPQNVRDVSDSITEEIIQCAKCRKGYRVIKPELEFLERFSFPLPRLCPDCRHWRRFDRVNPMRLWKRSCQCAGAESENGVYVNTVSHQHHGADHCPNEFETSYAPDRKEIVYCEQCYNAEVV